MPSTYTVNLGIEKPATGEQSGTWGDTTNVNFDIIDQAVNGSVRVTLTSAGTSGSPNDLNIVNGSTTSSEGRNKWIEIYSASDLGGSAYVRLVPNDAEKILFIRNSLAGSQSVLLFQGTYNASNDLEIPAGVDMVVKFDGAGASATVTDVFTKLRATEITTPTLTAGTADINGGSVDGATVGAASASTGAFTTLTASTSLNIASSTTVDGVLDEDNMASDSATKLATQQSIKAYVDSQVGTVDTLAEILANGNTSGANNLIIDNGQAITTNTVNETTAGSGVTIDSVLLKDDGVNATNLEITNIKANDGTAAATIANSTGNFTITNFISNSVDIGGGAIDGTVIGANSSSSASFTTAGFTGLVEFDGTAGLQLDNGAQVHSWSLDDNFTSRFNIGTSSTAAAWIFGSNNQNYWTVSPSGVTVNQDSNDVDFRVESNNKTYMFYVDAGTDTAYFGGSDNRGFVNIEKDAPLASDGAFVSPHIALQALSQPTDNDGFVGMSLATSDSNNYGFTIGAQRTTGGQGNLVFRNHFNSATGTVMMEIKSGSGIVINDDGGDQDFRVESDNNSHMLFVNAGSDKVGVGVSDPQAELFVRKDTAGPARIGISNSGTVGATTSSRLAFYEGNTETSYIERRRDGSGDTAIVTPAADNPVNIEVNGGNELASFTGSSIIFNQNGADQDFRVESDSNANALHVDAQYSVVGINSNDATTYTTTNSLVINGRDTALVNGVSASSNFQNFRFWNDTGTPYEIAKWVTNVGAGQVNRAEHSFQVNNGAGLREWLSVDYSGNVAFNDDSNDMDFRVESDTNTHALFVDAGNSRVGINNSSPAKDLDVTGSMNVTQSGGDYAATFTTAFDYVAKFVSSDAAGFIVLQDSNSTDNYNRIGAVGDSIQIESGNVENALFTSTASVFNENSADQDFRVESDNNANMLFVDGGNDRVAIGTNSPDTPLHVVGASGSVHTFLGYFGRETTNNTVDILTVSSQSFNSGTAIYARLVATGAVTNDAAVIEFWAALQRVGGGSNTATAVTPVISKAIVGTAIGAGTLAWSGTTLQYTVSSSASYIGYSMELHVSNRDSATIAVLP